MVGHASRHHQFGQRLYHIGRPYAARSPGRQTLPVVFVDDGQQLHSCAAMEPQVHEVVGPHTVLSRRPQTYTRAVIKEFESPVFQIDDAKVGRESAQMLFHL